MIAIVVVRDGSLPSGADEAVAEAGGHVLLAGDGTAGAATATRTATHVQRAELGPFAPAKWSAALAPVVRHHDIVLLPASPDGRDLAPRLAVSLARPLVAGAISVTPDCAVLPRYDGLVMHRQVIDKPVVATLQPGVRGYDPIDGSPQVETLELRVPADPADAEVIEVLDADIATMDLTEAARIVSGGAGLGGQEAFVLLRKVAASLGASYGASRVAADAGWVPQDRFIGTTGASVSPTLYVALGISGAVQHTSGLGNPDHIVAVNLDASAPMMAMADLGIITDARALLVELAKRLDVAR